jgi:short-subunit dehydrogenase
MFFEADPAGQERMHRVHVLATMRLTRAALPGMIARRTGNIVNVSSVAAFYHNPRNVSYGATKAWMNSFTEGLAIALEAIGSPVKVQCLCPGFTYTEFHDVLKVDRRAIPQWLWMDPGKVVEASLKGLERHRLFVIPGWQYWLAARSQRWLPQRLRHALALRYGTLTRRPTSEENRGRPTR